MVTAMENAGKHGVWQELLREIAGGLLLLAAVVAVRLTWGTGYILIPIVLFVLFAAYTIASGGNVSRATHASREDIDLSWARETLARPVWFSTLALTINWMSVIVVVNMLNFWDAPLATARETISIIVVAAIPVVAAIALAFVYFERGRARRFLKATPQ
jgi:hypothetical protein